MFEYTIKLIQRVKDLLHAHHEFFDALSQWYKDSKLARKSVETLFQIVERRELDLTVNCQRVEASTTDSGVRERISTWELESSFLNNGENEIRIAPGTRERAGVAIRAIRVFQEGPLQLQEVAFDGDEPTGGQDFQLACSFNAKPQAGSWRVLRDGALIFRLRADRTTRVVFSVEFADEGLSSNLRDIAKAVIDRVWKKRQEILNRLKGLDRGQRAIREAAEALDSFLDLAERQLRPAFEAVDSTTLDAIIDATGNPDALIRRWTDQLVHEMPPIKRARNVNRSPSKKQVAPARSGMAKTLMMLTVTAALAAPVAYVAYGDQELRAKIEEKWNGIAGKQAGSKPPASSNNGAKTVGKSGPAEEFYVVQASSTLSVRSASAIDKGIPFARFRNAGLSNQPAPLQKLSGPHPSATAASESLARMLQPGSLHEHRLADGKFAILNGQSYAIDDWGNVDWKLINERVGWKK